MTASLSRTAFLAFLALAPSLAWAAPILVAVEQKSGGAGTATALAAQLNDDTWFDFTATVVTATQIDSAAELAAYDVVVLADSGYRDHDWSAAMASALVTFVSGGGGVVSAGWADFGVISTTSGGADLDEVMPIDAYPDSTNYFCYGTLKLTLSTTPHDVTKGLPTTITTSSADIEVNPLTVDPGATVLGTAGGTCTTSPAQALVVDDYGLGRTVYIGLLYGAASGYNVSDLRSSYADRLLEQAVNWAAQGSCADSDGDGYSATSCGGNDCDDTQKTINPAAQEVCDTANVDEDCDGKSDDSDSSATGQSTWYQDADVDGYGGTTSKSSCDQPSGYVSSNTDCNDAQKSINPAAQEVCDASNVDEDCDGKADDLDSSATGQSAWYQDGDSDGYGGTTKQSACDQPGGYLSSNNDCDDSQKSINPGASELCNGVDDNCDGQIDENTAINTTSWYADADADGYGDATVSVKACNQPTGYVAGNSDCDDRVATTHPGAAEYCNGVDDDCNTVVDDATAVDAQTWYFDYDHDSYGDRSITIVQCYLPTGYSSDATDCDDTDAQVHPSATEYCNGVDDDCNGTVDENAAANAVTWYVDADGDGFGSTAQTSVSCSQPSGYVGNSGDCDDGQQLVYPGAVEYCNGIDDNCDGVVDEDTAADSQTWYADQDGDSYGDPATFLVQCYQPTGYLRNDNDCDDQAATIYPGADEYCNGVDDNCDGNVDEKSAVDAATWYTDGDADGYGDASRPVVACNQPRGAVAVDGDCDDGNNTYYPSAPEFCDDPNDYNCDGSVSYVDVDGDSFAACEECDDLDPSVHPLAAELCDGIDNNCDGLTDDASSVNPSTWYADGDGDNYGTTVTVVSCSAPTGYVALGGDCDDTDAAYNPGASEACDDPNDYNCDGSVGYADQDQDGFPACTECDDSDGLVNPLATEICNNLDDNCDGIVDTDAVDRTEYYPDADGDTFGEEARPILLCVQPEGYVETTGDCNDLDAGYNPLMSETCDDPNDYNCDGVVEYRDEDGDSSPACLDCDDAERTAFPGGTEICDQVDNDCNGSVDDNAVDQTTWYVDTDKDAYGDVGVSQEACDQPDGFVEDSTDCDDTVDTTFPTAEELCNTIDDNCNTEVDEGCDDVPFIVVEDTGPKDNTSNTCGCAAEPQNASAGLLGMLVAGGLLVGRRRLNRE